MNRASSIKAAGVAAIIFLVGRLLYGSFWIVTEPGAVFGPTCTPKTCFERPDVPSPRTPRSTSSQAKLEQWFAYHEELVARSQTHGPRARLVLVGDSITEQWLGTSVGRVVPEFADTATLFPQTFDADSTLVLAVSGDQTQHILWRLQHGELESVDPAVFVLLAGVNNLGVGFGPEEAAVGLIAIVEFLLRMRRNSNVVVLDILPKGAGPYAQMTTNVSSDVSAANLAWHLAWADSHIGKSGLSDRVALVPCEAEFLHHSADAVTVNENLYMGRRGTGDSKFNDLIHPNAAGHRVIAECLRPHLGELVLGSH